MFTGAITFLASFWAFFIGIIGLRSGSPFRRLIRLETGQSTSTFDTPAGLGYSLVSFLATIGVLSIVFGYLATIVHRSIVRRPVVDYVTALGGSAYIPFTGSGMVEIGLGECGVTDSDVDELTSHLMHLRQVDRICLDRTAITDKSLPYLVRIGSLKILLLRGTAITDDGLPVLASLQNLDELDISESLATQKSINALRAKLHKCRVIGP